MLIIITGFSIYANSLNGKFIMDDNVLIKENIRKERVLDISRIFKKNIELDVETEFKLYRPLQILSYIIDYSLWGLNPRGYHFTNILLHILSTITLYLLINIIYQDKAISFFTSITFLTHPVHTEAVAYISGRSDPLSTFLFLICFMCYIKRLKLKNILLYILMIISYILALLSRENTIILPALILGYHYFFKKKLQVIDFISISIITIIYITLRITILRPFLTHPVSSTNIIQRLPGLFIAMYNYIKILLFPLNLHMEYGNRLFKWTDPRTIAGILITLSLIMYILKNKTMSFPLYWFLTAIIPVSNIYPLNAYMAEHWLYLPSVGFFLILSFGLYYIYRIKKYRFIAIPTLIAINSSYSFLTVRQNYYWRDPLTFFERTLQFVPDSVTAYNNLGIIYSDMGEKRKGISYLEKAIELDPKNSKAYNNLGNVYSSIGKIDNAISLYKKAIEIDKTYTKAYFNLGNMYKSIGKNEEAITYYKKAIEISPNFIDGYVNLGVTYRDMDNTNEAIAVYKKAIALDPYYAVTYNNLSAAYYYNKQYALAIENMDKAVELGYKVAPELLEALKPYKEQKIE